MKKKCYICKCGWGCFYFFGGLLDHPHHFKYLYPKINKEYDTKKLISEKNKVENLLILRSNIFLLIFIISLGIILFFSIRYYRIKKLYKKRFENIIINSEAEEKKHTQHPAEQITLSETETVAINTKI